MKIDGTNLMTANLDMKNSIDIIDIRGDVTDQTAVVYKNYVDHFHMSPSGQQRDAFRYCLISFT